MGPNYDQTFGGKPKTWRRIRKQVLGKILSQARSVCDLGCGTGTTALELARRGIRVCAVDQSPVMGRIARQKARRSGTALHVILADMRTFRLPAQVDLVICEFNALNHVPRKSDLWRVTRAAARALKGGGHFFFDVHTPDAFAESGNWIGETTNYLVFSRRGYDPRRHKGWLEFTMFTARRNGMWKRSWERIEQVCWTSSEIRRALKDAGFVKIRRFDGSAFFPGITASRPHSTAFYLAEKKN